MHSGSSKEGPFEILPVVKVALAFDCRCETRLIHLLVFALKLDIKQVMPKCMVV